MDKTEAVFRTIEIIIASVGLLLVVFGWIVPHQQALKTERRRVENEKRMEQLRWQKDLVDKQISNLYGPVYALIFESEMLFSRILYQLGRSCVIPPNMDFYYLPENEQIIWKHFVDTYKIKYQMKIVEILRCNFHLIYNSEVPKCYKEFLDYALGWELLDNQKRNGVPNYYAYYYIFDYPNEFTNYIRKTLKILLDRQRELIKQVE